MRYSFFPILAVGMLSAVVVPFSRADESSWQIIKVVDRDYVTLQNVARFYQLQGNARLVDRHVTLGDGRTRLEVGSNPRELFIDGVKQWLSFPVVVQDDQVLISRFDLAKTVEPCLRPTMIENLPGFHTVVIDAGHGGLDRGASSRSGSEKDYTLDVIRDLKRALESKGFKVVLTRDGDRYLSLEGRADLANEYSDAVFVSVHFNSASDGGHANGFEVYAMTPRGAASTGDHVAALDQFEAMPGNEFDNASLALATCVQHSILGHIPIGDRGVRRARFAVLRLTRAPSILVEGGFLTNDLESRSINDPAWREKFAESIAQGVKAFQAVAEYKQPPKLLVDYRSEQLPLLGTIVNPATLAENPPGGRPGLAKVMPVANNGRASIAAPPVRMAGGFPSMN